MAMGGLDIVVKFIGDASSVTNEVSKVEGTGSRMKGWASGIGLAIGGAFAVDQVKDFVGAAEEAESVQQKLNQTMKNAGDVTGEYAKHATDLATSLMKKTGIDDETIKSGQAILATFHNVSNAAAQQSGIFDRATKASLDLSRAGYGDVSGAAKQLGKALEDPIKGITALSRAGVTFTAGQKDQIKALVESGQTLEAQKLIMKEVENQVQGVAEKTATSGEKMKVAWGETKESLGKALLPALEAITPVLAILADLIQKNAFWLVPLAAAILAVVAAMKLWALVNALLSASLLTNPVFLIAAAIVLLIVIIVLVVTHFDIFKQAAIDAFHWVLDAAQTAWNWISDNWPLILAILTGPFGIAVLLIVSNWDTIKNAAIDAFNAILGVITTVWDWIVANWPLLLAILTGPIGIATLLIVDNWNTIKNALGAAIDFMVGLWNNLVAFIAAVPGRVLAALASVAGFIITSFWNGLRVIYDLIGEVVGWFAGLPGRILGALGGLAGAMYSAGVNAMSHFLSGLESMMGHIAGRVASFVGDMLSKLNPFGSPKTVAFYRGQDVMRDYVAGAQSVQGRSVAAFRALGASAASAPVPATVGGSTFNINVSVDAGVSPAEVGAVIVDRIRAYERLGGKDWRAS